MHDKRLYAKNVMQNFTLLKCNHFQKAVKKQSLKYSANSVHYVSFFFSKALLEKMMQDHVKFVRNQIIKVFSKIKLFKAIKMSKAEKCIKNFKIVKANPDDQQHRAQNALLKGDIVH